MSGKRAPNIVQKPWGTEEIWGSTHHSVGKLLTINGGHRLSRKYHRQKNHSIRILKGILDLEVGPLQKGGPVDVVKLHEGEGYYLEAQTIHRFCAESGEVKILEVSNQGPDDSVRLEDDYRRIENIPRRGPQSEK